MSVFVAVEAGVSGVEAGSGELSPPQLAKPRARRAETNNVSLCFFILFPFFENRLFEFKWDGDEWILVGLDSFPPVYTFCFSPICRKSGR